MFTIPAHKGNANQNHTKFLPHPSEWLASRTAPTTNVGEDAGKRNPHTLLVAM
jgi:hypothetical protein